MERLQKQNVTHPFFIHWIWNSTDIRKFAFLFCCFVIWLCDSNSERSVTVKFDYIHYLDSFKNMTNCKKTEQGDLGTKRHRDLVCFRDFSFPMTGLRQYLLLFLSLCSQVISCPFYVSLVCLTVPFMIICMSKKMRQFLLLVICVSFSWSFIFLSKSDLNVCFCVVSSFSACVTFRLFTNDLSCPSDPDDDEKRTIFTTHLIISSEILVDIKKREKEGPCCVLDSLKLSAR